MKLLCFLLAAWFIGSVGAAPTPDGFWFERNDHFLTPSEAFYFTFKIMDEADDVLLGAGVEFTVTDLRREELASGETRAMTREGDLAVFRVLDPEQVAKLPRGWLQLNIRLKSQGGDDWFRMKFYVDPGPFTRRVVYLMDSVTPEGYAFWCNRETGNLIEPLRSFPEQGEPDCVVVSTFTPLPEPVFERLQQYLREGGRAVFYGVNHPQLDELNPFAIDREQPVPDGYRRDRDDRPLLLVNAAPVDGAQSIGVTADGEVESAALSYGKGRVVASRAALKPGRGVRLLLEEGLGIRADGVPERAEFALPAADAEGFREGISRGNFGRFGWLDNDRTNELSLRPEHTFRMWDVEQDYFCVSFSGQHQPGLVHAIATNWLAKTLIGTGGRWGRGTEIVWGLGTPGVLLRNAEAASVGIASPMLGRIAFPVNGGTRTQVLPRDGKVTLDGLAANWLLVWEANARFDAWPLLISFNRRVRGAEMREGELKLTFDRPGIDLSVMPLGGVRHYTPEEVAGWTPALPADIETMCRTWNRRLAARTVGCVETYRLARDGATVEIRNDFQYLELANAWGIEPEYFAPLPPLLPLYAATGLAEFRGEDSGVATLHGPLYGASGTRSTYTLTVPECDYPLPVTAADPRLDLAANRALFQRITEHLAVPGLTYIAPGFSVVERKPELIYPVRELEEACARSGPEAAAWKYIDVHRTLGGVTGNLMFKPYLDAVEGYDDTRERLNAKIMRNIRRDFELFPHKTFLRYRQEPGTGSWYLMAFLAPTRFNDGYWMFHDMNETIGIVLQTLGLYSRIIGDTAFFEVNEPYIDLFMSNYLVSNDWSWMASCAVEWGMGNNIDMLNAELAGWAGLARIKTVLGKPEQADFARYMAARAAVSTGARLLMKDFYNSLNFPVPRHLLPVIHEMENVEQAAQKRNAYLPLGVAHGHGEGWPSLWPTSISRSMLKHYSDGKDFYSNSKGVPVELLRFYRSSPLMSEALRHFEAEYRAAAYAMNEPYLYSRMAGNAYLKQPLDRGDLENMLYRCLYLPGASAKALGAGLADWESTAMVILLELLRETAGADDSAGTVPAGDERGGALRWETVKTGPGPHAASRNVTVDAEPEHVAHGAWAVELQFPAAHEGHEPVVFTRFDADAVREKACTALRLQVKAIGKGSVDFVLPNRDWSRRMIATVVFDGQEQNWQPLRLEFDRDFKRKTSGMSPEELRGELFLYRVAGDDGELTLYLDDIVFTP